MAEDGRPGGGHPAGPDDPGKRPGIEGSRAGFPKMASRPTAQAWWAVPPERGMSFWTAWILPIAHSLSISVEGGWGVFELGYSLDRAPGRKA